MVGELSCPLFVAVGEHDTNPSGDDIAELRRHVEQTGIDATFKTYSGAGHDFLADYRPSYREGPAFELWDDLSSYLEQQFNR